MSGHLVVALGLASLTGLLIVLAAVVLACRRIVADVGRHALTPTERARADARRYHRLSADERRLWRMQRDTTGSWTIHA